MNGRRVLAAGVLVATAAFVASAPSHAQTTDPLVVLDRTGTAPGEEMVVTGSGWPAGASVVVELCGQGALRGSADCDIANQRTVAVDATGAFRSGLTVGLPPVPCPCVVKATDQTSGIAATAAVAVQGIATVPITEAAQLPARRISIESMEIEGGSWTELLGAAADRTLVVTLENTGDVNIEDPALEVAWGRGSEPNGFVVVPDIEAMAPGETRTVTMELPRGAFAFGEYSATAEMQGLDERTSSRASVTTYPWLLLIVPLGLLQLALLAVRNRVRSRVAIAEEEEAPTLDELAAGDAEPVDDEPVIDAAAVGDAEDLDAPDEVEDMDDTDLDIIPPRRREPIPLGPVPESPPAPEPAPGSLDLREGAGIAAGVAAAAAVAAAVGGDDDSDAPPDSSPDESVPAALPFQVAMAQAREWQEAATRDREQAAEALAAVQARCDALIAGAEHIAVERATEVQANADDASATLADARRRADDLVAVTLVTVEEIRRDADRYRAEALELLVRTRQVSDDLLREARQRIEELLAGIERSAVERGPAPKVPTPATSGMSTDEPR
jgi:hypothetical protein